MKRNVTMRFAGIGLLAFGLIWLPKTASAQSIWPEDPISELLRSFAPAPPKTRLVEHSRVRRREVGGPSHARLEQAPHNSTAMQGRTIRAKAEVTVIDKDHVIVKLTRHDIGRLNRANVSKH